ncbi:MAG: 50S ribosomal protein L29 [Chloroflexi bacterium]|nr:50S ribosomal protein L29 [Chloroflexota bacterium]
MKTAEIRQLTNDEVNAQLDNAYQELFNLRFQKQVGQVTNPVRVRVVRRDIARLKTILRERELWAEWEAEQP